MTTFDREVWSLTMDWLSTGEYGVPEDPEKRSRIEQAAQRDSDVAQVDAWRVEAEPVPEWALKVDTETPHWGVEICNVVWPAYLEAQVRNIGSGSWHPANGWCGSDLMARRQWSSWATQALSDWVAEADPDVGNPLAADIHTYLGDHTADKAGAVRLLKETIQLGVTTPPAKFDAAFEKLAATSPLAEEMRGKIKYLQIRCGYRWEEIALELCRAIGDEAYRLGRPRAWHVGSCNGQIAFAARDDPLRIPTTAGVLVGLWAWLKEVPSERVATDYPDIAAVAERVRDQLGEMTPVKRWLAGRFFVGIRIWLERYDRGDLAPPSPALERYPTLGCGW